VEALEGRNLLAALLGPLTPAEAEPNDVVTQALDLGPLGAAPLEVTGSIGNGPAGAADVDWYSFTLTAPVHVTVTTLDRPAGDPFVGAVSLYDTDPYNYDPPYGSLSGYHLLAQAEGTGPQDPPVLERDLAAGTYYVAVSGAGNLYFHPLVADSGSDGSTGAYLLRLSASDLAPTTGPAILGGNPTPGSAVPASPVVVRVDFSAPLATTTVHLNQDPSATLPVDPFNDFPPTDTAGNPLPYPPSVWLTYNPTGTFGDGNDQPVLLSGGDFSTTAAELRVTPTAPLAPGYYRLFLAGDSLQHTFVVTDVNGNPLGADADHPGGQDLTFDFQVSGVEGRVGADAPADDTPATAHELGDVTHLVQLTGAIGDDPAFTAVPGADVDLYHFRVTGPGLYALDAEAFAGRIDSPLDVGLALYRLDPADGHTLQLVYANDNTLNATPTPDGWTLPLYTDSAVFAGVTAGDYYLAVSASGNTPDTTLGYAPGVDGIYDLNAGQPYSGPPGLSTGPYVLNVLLRPAGAPPHVTAVTPADGTTLAAPPTHLTVHFDGSVNLQQLAFAAYQASQTTPGLSPDRLDAVFVVGADGTTYYPRLQSYDPSGGQADFLMLDALPNGSYELHLSGPHGLTDLAGQPVAGNDPSGDYVVRFTVAGPVRGTPGDPTSWSDQEPNDGVDSPQVLGPLFPHELSLPPGVTVTRDFSGDPASAPRDTEDDYQFTLLQDNQTYAFNLVAPDGSALPAGTVPEVYDAAGNPVLLLPQGGSGVVIGTLDAGTYTVRVAGWSPDEAGAVRYQLRITLVGAPEAPVPLVVGPAPAFRIRLVTAAPPAGPGAPVAPPLLALPAPAAPVVTPGPFRDAAAAPETPATVLLALTAGPLGGPAGGTVTAAGNEPTPGPDRLLVSGAQLVARDRLIQVAVLTGVDGAGNTDPGAAPPGLTLARLETLIEDYTARAMESWHRLVDALFTASQAQADLPAPQAAPGGLCGDGLPDPAADDAGNDDPVTDDPGQVPAEGHEATGADDRQTDGPAAGGLSGLCLVVGLSPGLLAGEAAPRRRRRRRASGRARGGA
jgi:hypothetical protein